MLRGQSGENRTAQGKSPQKLQAHHNSLAGSVQGFFLSYTVSWLLFFPSFFFVFGFFLLFWSFS